MHQLQRSDGTVESEGRQMKQCWIYYKKKKNPPKKYLKKEKDHTHQSWLQTQERGF